MNKILITIIITLFFFQAFSQPDYKEYQSIGREINGMKEGKWVDISIDSIVYREGEYDNGMPVGIWKVYYPDGGLRKTTEYNNGKVRTWCLHKNKTKVIELGSDQGISDSVYKKIIYIEERAYSIYHDTIVSERIANYYGRNVSVEYRHPTKYQHSFYPYATQMLKENQFTGYLKQWREDSKPINEHYILNGEDHKTSYIYKKGILRHKYTYINDKLKSDSVYDKEGNYKRTLEF